MSYLEVVSDPRCTGEGPPCTGLLDDPARVLGDGDRRPSHICYDVLRWSAATWALDATTSTSMGVVMWQGTWPLLVGKRALEGHLFVPPEYRDELSNLVPFDGDEEALWALRIEKDTTVLDLFGLADYEAEVRKGQVVSWAADGNRLVGEVVGLHTDLAGARFASVRPDRGDRGGAITTMPVDQLTLAPMRMGELAFVLRGQDVSLSDHKSVEALDESLSTDVAVLAALTVLEVSESTKPTLDRLISILDKEGGEPLGEAIHDRVQEVLAEHEERGGLSNRDARFLEGLDTRPFDFCLLLLRGRRAGFEELALGEQLGLLKRAFTYVEPIVSNARKLTRFLEHGDAKGLRTRTSETAQRQVAAALLKDAAGLTPVEIADELGIGKPKNWDIKFDVPQVRREVDAGRELLRRALGTAGAEDLVRTRKAGMGWWRSLTEEQRSQQRQADWWTYEGWPEDLAGGLGFSAGTSSDEAGNA